MSAATDSAAELPEGRAGGRIRTGSLNFVSPKMEAAFRRSWRTAGLRTNRIWAACALSYYICIIIVMGVMDPAFLLAEQPVRLFVCLPLLVFELTVSVMMVRRWWLLDVSFLAAASAAFANAAVGHAWAESDIICYFFLMEMAVTYAFCANYFRAGFRLILLFSAVSVPLALWSILAAAQAKGLPESKTFFELMMVAGIAATTTLNAYSREILTRRNYRELLAARAELDHARAFAAAAVADEQTKSRFVAAVGTEFELPVRRVLDAACGEGRAAIEPARAQGYMDDIAASAQRLSSIISQVNAIATATPVTPNRIGINAAGYLERGVLRWSDALARRSLAPAVEADPGIALLANQSMADRMLDNILSNAAKFSPEGSIIELVARRTPDGRIAISVADRGPGIPEGRLNAAMEPFMQLDSGLNRQHEGLGLGLALTGSLASSNGASVELSRREGGGLEVRLVFEAAS
ncbi:MAG: sensor histidine kinase [Minwuia sp.]|uniref:sensor histidine kinase n=1 Tax=Minwuia sp. TaxID=2493630 RepID=UPI003A8AD55E